MSNEIPMPNVKTSEVAPGFHVCLLNRAISLQALATEEWPWSEHYEVSGVTRLADWSVPEGASSYCLRPLAEFRRSSAERLRTGQKLRSESGMGIFQWRLSRMRLPFSVFDVTWVIDLDFEGFLP